MPFETFGSDLYKGNTTDYATASTWTSVGCVTSITPPSSTVNDVEVPVCLNAASRAKTYLAGAYDPGECSYTIVFASTDIDTCNGLLGVSGSWKIKLGTSGKALAFNGHFKSFGLPELTEQGFIQVNCTIKVSGTIDEVTHS